MNDIFKILLEHRIQNSLFENIPEFKLLNAFVKVIYYLILSSADFAKPSNVYFVGKNSKKNCKFYETIYVNV